MDAFPAFIDLQNRPVLIVGGGAAALAKARLLIAAKADVMLAATDVAPETRAELEGKARFVVRAPRAADFERALLVFIAAGDAEAAGRWAGAARAAGALVNVVDRPDLCDFTTPAIVDRGRVSVAISTGGAAPVFARNLRADIEALIPAGAGVLADFAARYHDAVKARFDAGARRAFWEAFFAGQLAADILAGEEARAHEAMIEAINRPQAEQKTGVVHLVGAGPGDPELLTLRALRLIQQADVILYDRLVGEEILALARRDAERLYVGKAKADHAVPQQEIEARLIAFAREGKTVVRLKGGDPFIFGRGGEELDALRDAGVPVHITPGVTAATGCAASARLALTHRDFAQAVTFVTGHAKGDADPALDWSALAALKNTLVVYMGVGKADAIAGAFIAHGRAPETPVAVIENGTRADEKVIKGTLDTLGAMIEVGGIKGPALLVIGEVAALADGRALLDIAGKERLVA